MVVRMGNGKDYEVTLREVKINFQCQRCGNCCTNIICNVDFGKAGLFLMPNERLLFPPETILPMYGMGLKGKSRPRPKHIYAYQYARDPCIHYSAETNECKIYNQRPITCRSFPLELTLLGGILHRECPAIAKFLKEDEQISAAKLKNMENETQASKQISQYIQKIFSENKGPCWGYDAEKRKWTQFTQEMFKERFSL